MTSRTLLRGMWIGLVLSLASGCARSASEDRVPPGSTLVVRLTEAVSSEGLAVGDAVWAETIVPVLDENGTDVLVPAGSSVDGKVVDIDPYGNKRITLAFERVVSPSGRARAIEGRAITIVAVSTYPPLEAVDQQALDASRAAIAANVVSQRQATVLVPVAENGAVELPRGQTLAVHIDEPATAPASSHDKRRAGEGSGDEQS